MKNNYNIKNPNEEDKYRLSVDLINVQDKFVKNGYVLPVNALQLVKDMYNDEYAREVRQADKRGVDIPWICEDRIEMLGKLTCLKLLNTAMKTFGEDPNGSLKLSFVGGVPEAKTAEFLNLKDETEQYINIDRTSSLKLAHGFYHGDKAPDIMTFEICPQGENVTMYQNGLKEVVCEPESLFEQ